MPGGGGGRIGEAGDHFGLRESVVVSTDPVEAERLLHVAQQSVDQRWEVYQEMSTRGANGFTPGAVTWTC